MPVFWAFTVDLLYLLYKKPDLLYLSLWGFRLPCVKLQIYNLLVMQECVLVCCGQQCQPFPAKRVSQDPAAFAPLFKQPPIVPKWQITLRVLTIRVCVVVVCWMRMYELSQSHFMIWPEICA